MQSQGNEEEKVKLNIWLPEEKLPGFRQYANSFFSEYVGSKTSVRS